MNIENLLEFSGPIGLLCALIVCFGEVRRLLIGPNQAQYIMGLVFGLVSMLEMQMPISPFEGIIVDLRNVPIVLAGAFLGWRGLATCLLVAVLTRAHIGGAGAVSGIIGMLIAGYAGAVWDRATRQRLRRSFPQLLGLGALVPVSFLGVLFLPAEVATWFLFNAAPVLGLIYLTVIPLVGGLLQREILRIEAELHPTTAPICPESGLLPPAAFARGIVQMAISGARDGVAGILVVEPVYPRWLAVFWGGSARGRVQEAMALGLAGRLRHADQIGLSEGGRLLVPLSASEAAGGALDLGALAHCLSRSELHLSLGQSVQLHARLRVLTIGNAADIRALLQGVDRADTLGRNLCGHEQDCAAAPACAKPCATSDGLFDKYDLALTTSQAVTVKLRD
ncbi:hypothetical protein KUH32_03580 [Thalassococcus sp. CAU 1522]|uniref:Signal transduction histidine kinase 5TM receptor LytS transmembrane region domain-containing protein n=1 Tax=Thalassococcus arenae TaxID=2851652 RepID=A0ABS6N4B1_9RHOB|nr:LytS/YhcK type 5TM receptor domain-containing protein [Thalassococcus arenae]MBV2358844.1 hypothetical protein [Thalassococcus arenae]